MYEEDSEVLGNIRDKIKELMWEAKDIVDQYDVGGPNIKARANAYWFPHISMALDTDHDYVGGSMCSLQDTIDEIKEWHSENPQDD